MTAQGTKESTILIADGKIQIVPQVLVAGGGDGSTGSNLFNAWLSQMISQNVPKGE